jgi:hypothetical protein
MGSGHDRPYWTELTILLRRRPESDGRNVAFTALSARFMSRFWPGREDTAMLRARTIVKNLIPLVLWALLAYLLLAGFVGMFFVGT